MDMSCFYSQTADYCLFKVTLANGHWELEGVPSVLTGTQEHVSTLSPVKAGAILIPSVGLFSHSVCLTL